MQPHLSQLKTARKIDELEETKNRLIKCQHRLKECDKLYEKYAELRKHWDIRNVRYQSLKKDHEKYKDLQEDYEELIEIRGDLEEEVQSLQEQLNEGMIEMEDLQDKLRTEKVEGSKVKQTAKKFRALEERYQLLKAAYIRCREKSSRGTSRKPNRGSVASKASYRPGTPPRAISRATPPRIARLPRVSGRRATLTPQRRIPRRQVLQRRKVFK